MKQKYQAEERIYTKEDIYALPDGTRAELIDGKIYYMAAPGRRHQEVVGELFRRISNFIVENNGSYKPYVSPFAVFLNEDDQNYVEPDISVICDPNKLTDEGCKGAPDWIIEVVSPSSIQMDYLRKLLKYSTAGVREYWVVDPAKDRITAYYLETEEMKEYKFHQAAKVGIFPDFEIDFNGI